MSVKVQKKPVNRWSRDYSLRVLSKAERLIEEGRVIRIRKNFFYVIGDHGKYFVSLIGGDLRCNCKGFRNRGFCSHIVAVLLTLLRKEYSEKLDEALRRRLEQNLEYIKRGIVPS